MKAQFCIHKITKDTVYIVGVEFPYDVPDQPIYEERKTDEG